MLLTPGDQPFHRLAASLLPFLEPDDSEVDRLAEVEKLGRKLAAGDVRLGPVVDRLLEKSGGTDRLLLVVDQFEELCTQSPPEKQHAFAEMLQLASQQSSLTVVIAVRGDYFGKVRSLPLDFASAVDRGQMNLLAMSREGMAEVIEKPAERAGQSFEPGLAKLILDEVRDEPGQLPLVEFALTELWQRSQPGSLLTLEAYIDAGRVSGAIAQRAQQFSASLSPPDRETLRRLLSRLVRVVERPEAGLDTRQRLRLSELPSEMLPLVRRLADERLVVTGRDPSTGEETAEVAHEALIREWQELRGWLDQDRAFLLYRQDLQRYVERWVLHGRSDEYVLQGDPLGEAERWRRTHGQDLSTDQVAFLEAGVARRNRGLAEDRARQRRLQRLSSTLLAASIGMAALLGVIFAINRQLQAHKVGLSSQLLARRSQAELAESPQAAALLAREAVTRSRAIGGAPLAEAETALRAALAQLGGKPIVHRALAYDRRVLGAVLGRNGRWLATETRDGKVRLARLTQDADVAEVLTPIATDQGDSRWAPFRRIAVPTASVRFSPQGGWVLLGTVGGPVELFRLHGRPDRLLTLSSLVSTAAFSADESALALGMRSGQVQWLDLSQSTLQPVELVTMPGVAGVDQVEISPDGRWIAARSIGNSPGLWLLRLASASGPSSSGWIGVQLPAQHGAIPQRVASTLRELMSAPGSRALVELSRGGHEVGPGTGPFAFMFKSASGELVFAPDSRAFAFQLGDSVCYTKLDGLLGKEVPARCTDGLGSFRSLVFGQRPEFLAGIVEDGLGIVRIDVAERNRKRTLVRAGPEAMSVGSTVIGLDATTITTLTWLSVPWGKGDSLSLLDSRGAWMELRGRQGDLALTTIDHLQRGAGPRLLASPEFLLAGLGKPTEGLAADEAGQWLLGWTSPNEVRAWRPPSALLPSFQPAILDDDSADDLAFTSRGDLVGSVGGSKYGAHGHLWRKDELKLEDVPTEVLLAERPSKWSVVAQGGRYFALLDGEGRLTRWDLSSEGLPEMSTRLVLPAEIEISQIALAPTGRWLIANWSPSGSSGTFPNPAALKRALQESEELLLWDLEASEEAIAPQRHGSSGSLAFDPQGQWLVIGSYQGGFNLLALPGFQTLDPLNLGILSRMFERGLFSTVEVSSNGRWVFFGAADSAGELWEMDDLVGGPRRTGALVSRVSAAAFSRDSHRLLVGTVRGKVVVLDLTPLDPAWDRKHELAVGDDPITSCALSADGRLAFAFAADGSNLLWDLGSKYPAASAVALPIEQWRPKQRAPGAHAVVTHAAFSPDGRYLAI